MLSDQDYIFIDLINDSRIKVNIKHVNENIYKSKICKNIKLDPVIEFLLI